MRILPAIILLLWTVCYGRCFAEQNGLLRDVVAEAGHCSGECCEVEKGNVPPSKDGQPCKVCDFIKSGGAPSVEQFTLEAPVLVPMLIPDVAFAALVLLNGEDVENTPEAVNTGPPEVGRMCEWMASTATPVRGPDAVA